MPMSLISISCNVSCIVYKYFQFCSLFTPMFAVQLEFYLQCFSFTFSVVKGVTDFKVFQSRMLDLDEEILLTESMKTGRSFASVDKVPSDDQGVLDEANKRYFDWYGSDSLTKFVFPGQGRVDYWDLGRIRRLERGGDLSGVNSPKGVTVRQSYKTYYAMEQIIVEADSLHKLNLKKTTRPKSQKNVERCRSGTSRAKKTQKKATNL